MVANLSKKLIEVLQTGPVGRENNESRQRSVIVSPESFPQSGLCGDGFLPETVNNKKKSCRSFQKNRSLRVLIL
jgi:hypothetical protein